MISKRLFVIFALLFFGISNAFAVPKLNVGWVEKIKLVPGDLIIHAKLDTGADSSSIDAQNVEEFSRGGQEWVRFSIVNRYGDKITIENKVHRIAVVKRHFGKSQKRKVIQIGICLGETYMQTEVTLIDRKDFEYQMLLGRQFLAGNAIIDPSVTYTAEPGCAEKIAELEEKKSKKTRVTKKSKKDQSLQQEAKQQAPKVKQKEKSENVVNLKQQEKPLKKVEKKEEVIVPEVAPLTEKKVEVSNNLPPAVGFKSEEAPSAEKGSSN